MQKRLPQQSCGMKEKYFWLLERFLKIVLEKNAVNLEKDGFGSHFFCFDLCCIYHYFF